jgi:hypothetical protein
MRNPTTFLWNSDLTDASYGAVGQRFWKKSDVRFFYGDGDRIGLVDKREEFSEHVVAIFSQRYGKVPQLKIVYNTYVPRSRSNLNGGIPIMWKSTCFIKSKLRRNTRLSAENFPDLLL